MTSYTVTWAAHSGYPESTGTGSTPHDACVSLAYFATAHNVAGGATLTAYSSNTAPYDTWTGSETTCWLYWEGGNWHSETIAAGGSDPPTGGASAPEGTAVAVTCPASGVCQFTVSIGVSAPAPSEQMRDDMTVLAGLFLAAGIAILVTRKLGDLFKVGPHE